jgi:hypothetical protein
LTLLSVASVLAVDLADAGLASLGVLDCPKTVIEPAVKAMATVTTNPDTNLLARMRALLGLNYGNEQCIAAVRLVDLENAHMLVA